DLHWDATTLDLQMQAFDMQARKALELGLPLIIHSRDGLDATLEVLRGLPKIPQAVLHSFGGSAKDAERVLMEFGDMYFGINGIVTFKKATTKEVLPVVPPGQLLLETDSPYLAPVPERGKLNESAYMVHTARFVANEMGMSVDDLGEITTQNACRLFGISNKM
ncbi:MAG: TatD family hydrolase, partial [Muribaculaceae bacterium]|nr:TatD family hydrolase [Muribaculaceae bacterium]